ncbi:MAG: hypothetical protein Q8936_20935 [Bacillota bacterium]|nr:hypothetical protein [Bacillota bacterium]
MNKKLGLYSAIIVAITTFIFGISLLTETDALSYFICIILSWGYILLACTFYTEAVEDRKALALGGVAFSCLYGVFVDVVYFTQLTAVSNETISNSALQILSYQSPGSLFFSFDLFGYGMMALSTFLIGISIIPKNKKDKWLKALMMIHGIFLFSCVGMPILNVFEGSGDSGAFAGTVALLCWCLYFVPIGILSALHFRKAID